MPNDTMNDDDPKAAANGDVMYVVGILAGGRSRRMGRSKARLTRPDGTTLLEHVANVAERLQPAPDETSILGEFAPQLDSLSHLPVLHDIVPDAGPLAGLCALLDRAGDRWALLLACDMPWLDVAAPQTLLDHAGPDIDVVAFACNDRPDTFHACCALYHPRVAPAALAELHESKRSLQKLLGHVRTRALTPSPDLLRQLTNVNTPQDYDRLQADS